MAETPKKSVRSKKATKVVPAEAVGVVEETPRPLDDDQEQDEPQYTRPEPLEVFPIVRHEERLQKIIASAGVTSRRKAEELILEGRVQVNGTTVNELGNKADAALDHIRVDGKLLAKPGQGSNRLRYAVLNKPKGYITTASDPEGRPTVMEFFPGGTRVFPVGRLDYQSEGLLLMTNDGELANLLTRAANKVQKVYLVKISRKPSDEAIAQLRAGIMIDKGRNKDEKLGRVLTQPAGIRRVRDAENPWYEVTLTEGRNREIRKMFEEVGHFVEKIRRVGFGPLVLDLPPGEVRELTPDEILALQRSARGIRTPSRLAIPPVSVPPIRHKAKRATAISRPGPIGGAKAPSRPVLSEWPAKPANRPTGPAASDRPVPTVRPAVSSGKSFTPRPPSSRLSGDRPTGNRSFADRPNSSRPATQPRATQPRAPRPQATESEPRERPAYERSPGTRTATTRPGSAPRSPSRPATSDPKPFRPRSSERPAPRSRPVPVDLPDLPETPSFGITITREPAPGGKSFNDRPGRGTPQGGSPFGARRPATGSRPSRAGGGSTPGTKGGFKSDQGRSKPPFKSRPKKGQ